MPDSVEIVSYQTKVTGTESLIERGKDADIIMVANLPLNAEVIKGCKNLKMLAVAFTGIDHIAMDACKEQGLQYATVQAIQMLQFQILSLDF